MFMKLFGRQTNPINQPVATQYQAPKKIFGLEALSGIPAVSAETIMATDTVRHYVQKLSEILVDIPKSRKKELVEEVIRAFVENVHLLPASQSYHHNESGGLLLHSLEVAYNAAQYAYTGPTFGFRHGNSMRREAEPKYRYAAFVCGLFHDIGKPQSDIFKAYYQDKTWDTVQPLAKWVEKNIPPNESYNIEFLAGRGFTHEDLTMIEIGRILPIQASHYLKILPQPGIDGSLPGKEVFAARNQVWAGMFNVLTGKSSTNNDVILLRNCVSKADSDSTDGWRNKSQDVSHRICNAIQHQIAKGAWVINDERSPIIISHDAIYIRWHEATHAITEYLTKHRASTGFDAPDRYADILIDRGIAEPVYHLTKNAVRYHKVEVEYEKLTTTFACLRIIQAHAIFTPAIIEDLPKPIKARIIDGGFVTLADAVQPKSIQTDPDITLRSTTDKNSDDQRRVGKSDLDNNIVKLIKEVQENGEEEINTQLEAMPSISAELSSISSNITHNKDTSVSDPGVVEQISTSELSRKNNKARLEDPSFMSQDNITSKTTNAAHIETDDKDLNNVAEVAGKSSVKNETQKNQAVKWYSNFGNCGAALKVIAIEYQTKRHGDNAILLDADRICINTDLLKNRGTESQDLINELLNFDLIELDPFDNRPICYLDQYGRKAKFIRLTTDATKHFLMPLDIEKVQQHERIHDGHKKSSQAKSNKHQSKGKDFRSVPNTDQTQTVHDNTNNVDKHLSKLFRQTLLKRMNDDLPFKVIFDSEIIQFHEKEAITWFLTIHKSNSINADNVLRAIRSDIDNIHIHDGMITMKKVRQ